MPAHGSDQGTGPERPRTPDRTRGQPRRVWYLVLALAATVALALAFLLEGRMRDGRRPPRSVAAPPPAVPEEEVDPWQEAAEKVEEDRGEPMGRAARVRVPPQLQHYSNKKRFLAIQVAAWQEAGYEIPHDDAHLARLVAGGELVEVPALGEHHILYGVGANATGEPFAHYDRATGQEIPLFERYDVFEDAAAEWTKTIDEKKAAAAQATATARKTRARRTRRNLQARARSARREAAALEKRRARVKAWYDDYAKRRLLVSEWHAMSEAAATVGPRPYDLDDPEDRRALRGRLLSHLRPPARERMRELAAQYHARFERHLPVTSLVRTEHYQRQLGETNPNATSIQVPPHTTGLAYDVYYRYLAKDEQTVLMALVAAEERAGLVEALRERRNHIHIFAFAHGRRPPEALVAEAMGIVRGTRTVSRTPSGSIAPARASSGAGRAKAAAGGKAAPRQPAARRTGTRTRRQ